METFLDDRVKVVTGDITKQDVDVIVNAANSSLMGGSGVDGAIHKAGGTGILDECKLIRKTQYPGGLPTGDVVMTSAGNLKAKGVIHTVGPVYGRESNAELLLSACYKNSLKLLHEKGYKTIAFPAISTGVFGYPREEAAQVSSKAIKEILPEYPDIELVLFVFFSEKDKHVFLENHVF